MYTDTLQGTKRSLWGQVVLWGIGLVGGAIAVPLPAIALCPAELPAVMDAIAARPELARARLGMHVETAEGDSLYSRDSDRFFVPASTLKLLTTAAVLTGLGPDFTIRTAVHGTTAETGVTTLRVEGRGDPSFTRNSLTELATQLRQQGIDQVDTLYGEDLPSDSVNPSWEWEDVQAGYGAPVNRLILNQNEIVLSLIPRSLGSPLQVMWKQPSLRTGWQIENTSITVPEGSPEFVTVGRDLARPILRVSGQLAVGSLPEAASVAIPNPGEVFLQAFQAALAQEAIVVAQTQLTEVSSTIRGTELAAITSPPLSALLIPANRDSNNLYAEALLKQLGRSFEADEQTGPVSLAIALHILRGLGVDPDQVVMVDGSGLARKNLVTPAAMVDTLQAMARSPLARPYRDSLAVAGVSGTLRNRFRDTAVAGRLWGKSGAISRNFALAGYLDIPDYKPITFSIFINHINMPGRIARQIIDDIVLQLSTLKACDAL